MAKKILSTVLAIVMLMSIVAIGAYATNFTDYELGVKCIICGALEGNEKEATWRTKLAGYLDQDPDIIERNLAFWDDDIISEYNAASTTAQWRALYNKMQEGADSYDGPLDGYYPLYRYTAADKAAIDVKYEVTEILDDTLTAREGLDVVKPGDTVMVTVSAKTSFLVYSLDLGVIYDYNKVELNTAVGVESLLDIDMWNQVGSDNSNFGFVSGKDKRATTWPASMRDNDNDEYDTYKLAKVSYCTKAVPGTISAEQFSDFTPVFKFPFKVLSGVADGTVLDFFCVDDASFSLDDLELYDTYGETAFVQAYRALSPYVAKNPDGVAHFDHAWTFENASITVGEAAPVVPADYDALDAAIDEFDANTDAADYTAASWAAYADAATAAKAVDRDLTADDQQTIDDAEAALTGAKNALVKNEVKSATVAGTPTIGSNATVNVVVDGAPTQLRLTDGTNVLNFASDAEGVAIVNNTDGTQTWTIKVFAAGDTATYDVYAKYANFTETPVTFTINATEGLDLSIHSIVVMDMYPNNMNGGTVTKGKHTIIITTSTDVSKIQFVDPMGTIEAGSTFTYEPKNVAGNCKYEDKDGERTWTITHSFGPMGEWSMPIRTRAESTTFITTDTNLTARVVY